MKHLALAFTVAVAAFATNAAFAAQPAATCKAMEARIAQSAAEFIKVNAAAGTIRTAATPADFQRALSRKNATLQDIADRLWIQRGEMANRNCDQAAAFTY